MSVNSVNPFDHSSNILPEGPKKKLESNTINWEDLQTIFTSLPNVITQGSASLLRGFIDNLADQAYNAALQEYGSSVNPEETGLCYILSNLENQLGEFVQSGTLPPGVDMPMTLQTFVLASIGSAIQYNAPQWTQTPPGIDNITATFQYAVQHGFISESDGLYFVGLIFSDNPGGQVTEPDGTKAPPFIQFSNIFPKPNLVIPTIPGQDVLNNQITNYNASVNGVMNDLWNGGALDFLGANSINNCFLFLLTINTVIQNQSSTLLSYNQAFGNIIQNLGPLQRNGNGINWPPSLPQSTFVNIFSLVAVPGTD